MWPPPYFYPSMIASFSNVGCLPRHQHPIWEPTVSQNEILRLSSSSSSSSIRYWKCRDISLLAHDISLSFFWSFVALNFSFFFFFWRNESCLLNAFRIHRHSWFGRSNHCTGPECCGFESYQGQNFGNSKFCFRNGMDIKKNLSLK